MAKAPTLDPAADASIIDGIASQQLGAAAGAAPAAPVAASSPPPAEAKKGDTAQQAAATTTSPVTEAGAASEQPVTYKVQMDGSVREFTPEQIAQTTKRYADLNYKHQTEIAPIKPAIDILNRVMAEAKAQGTSISGDELAAFLTQTLTQAANQHNTTFGNQPDPGTSSGRTNTPVQTHSTTQPMATGDDFEAQLAQWESDNAVTLPPSYKNMARQNQSLMQSQTEMKSQMAQLLQHMQGVQQTAQGQMQGAVSTSNAAYMRTIANNLQSAQAKFGLQDAQEKDFMMFASERGYSIEDFIDPSLTEKVASDFKAVKDTPEMERLKSINQRRQAFTGTLTPGASANGQSSTAANPDADFINSVTDQTLKDRNKL